jgi:hypothetical protein
MSSAIFQTITLGVKISTTMEIQDLLKKQMTQSKEEIYSFVLSLKLTKKREPFTLPLNGSAEIFDVRLQTMFSGVGYLAKNQFERNS